MPRLLCWADGRSRGWSQAHTEVVKRERVREAAPKLDGAGSKQTSGCAEKDHSDFPVLECLNKRGWVAFSVWTTSEPARPEDPLSLSASDCHTGRDSPSSASWPSAGSSSVPVLGPEESSLVGGGFMFVSEPGAGGCIRWAAPHTGCPSSLDSSPGLSASLVKAQGFSL